VVNKQRGNFRWVYHSVEDLKLFYDIRFSADETCTEEEEIHVKEVDLPEPVLRMIAGKQIPELPPVVPELVDEEQNSGGDTAE